MTNTGPGRRPSRSLDEKLSTDAKPDYVLHNLAGWSHYARGLHDHYPDTWDVVFCPSGEYHDYRRKFLRKPVCTLCGYVRPYR